MARQRLDARAGAEALGISVDALRMRARRGTLESEHDANGRLHVWLDMDELQPDSSALISELRAHNATLKEQLAAERQASAELRRLLGGALERIPPQLEASPGWPENPPESEPQRRGTPDPQENATEPEKRSSRELSWWRRLFEGA